MGKKSKRRNNKNPKTSCYHGCTKKEYNNGEFYQILEKYKEATRSNDVNDFFLKNKYLVSPLFGRYVIAHIADDYLHGKDDNGELHLLMLFLHIRYLAIPQQEGKGNVGCTSDYYKKYCRDINTERGKINCIAREIPCTCMEAKRIEAKSMEKVAMCCRCKKEFLKKKMRRCKGCDHAQYCSKRCSKIAWPHHKARCKKNYTYSSQTPTESALAYPASPPTPAPVLLPIPSSVDELTGVDAVSVSIIGMALLFEQLTKEV